MSRKALEPNLWTVSDTFKHMYSVPVYQRPYSWENSQINVLLDDIIEAYFLPEEERKEGYFIGSIYIHDKNEKLNGLIQKYEIIDGQQRLTTVSLMMLVLYSLACQYEISENDQTFLNIKTALWKYVDRNYEKKNRVVSLNSIEKNCYSNLFDNGFDSPKSLMDYCNHYLCCNSFEKRVISNFTIIYNRVESLFPKEKKNDLLDFADFILNYVQIIAIDSTCSISKAFSIFESINSKGKPLDEIDKIKTYIFSMIDEDSYDHYLELWGKLIIETNDQLYDYLYNYIKAYIAFYRQNINVDNFKALSRNEIRTYFHKNEVAEGLKSLLEDLLKKVKYYNMLVDFGKAYELVRNIEFRFFFSVFIQIGYKHPKPLFLRCIEEFDTGKIGKDELVSVVRETVKYMFEFLSISNRDSKDAITLFSSIMNDIYARGSIDKDVLINLIAKELISKALTPEKIKSDLMNMDAYDQNNKIAVALLSLYESTEVIDNDKFRISYDKAFTLFYNYGHTLSLDHLLVQSPEIDSKFKYYRDKNNKLVLKEGNDFEDGYVVSGMDYDQFIRLVLNKIGNLRLWYKDTNSSRQNDALQLENYSDFTSYNKIQTRGANIVNTLIDMCLPMPSYNPDIKTFNEIKDNKMNSETRIIQYDDLNRIQEERLVFWTGFNELIQKRGKPFGIRKATTKHYYHVAIGNSEAFVSIELVNKSENVVVELYIPNNKELFDSLYEQYEEIENDLGFSLTWDRLDEKKASRIKYYIYGLNLFDHSNYDQLMNLIIDVAIKMRDVFSKYI